MEELTVEDWVEIYYALESKARAVYNGEYGKPKKRWEKHLRSIMEKIGADGRRMI